MKQVTGVKRATQGEVAGLLSRLSIGPGDVLLVHSAVQFLGQPEGGVQMYLDALLEAVGPEGTLAVPTFNFAFARGEDYDPARTPSQGMGVLSEQVRMGPGARRTSHPLQSLAAIGRQAEDLARRDTPGAFDPGSAFERLLELDGKLLLLGASVQAASIVHYSEQQAAVPYRYWKEFQGRVRTPGGWEVRSYRMFGRDLDLDPQLGLAPIQHRLEARRQWTALPLNYGQVAVCRLRDFVAAAGELLAEDPWGLVGNRDEVLARLRLRS